MKKREISKKVGLIDLDKMTKDQRVSLKGGYEKPRPQPTKDISNIKVGIAIHF